MYVHVHMYIYNIYIYIDACMKTWSYTYSMRVYSLGAYIRLCYK